MLAIGESEVYGHDWPSAISSTTADPVPISSLCDSEIEIRVWDGNLLNSHVVHVVTMGRRRDPWRGGEGQGHPRAINISPLARRYFESRDISISNCQMARSGVVGVVVIEGGTDKQWGASSFHQLLPHQSYPAMVHLSLFPATTAPNTTAIGILGSESDQRDHYTDHTVDQKSHQSRCPSTTANGYALLPELPPWTSPPTDPLYNRTRWSSATTPTLKSTPMSTKSLSSARSSSKSIKSASSARPRSSRTSTSESSTTPSSSASRT